MSVRHDEHIAGLIYLGYSPEGDDEKLVLRMGMTNEYTIEPVEGVLQVTSRNTNRGVLISPHRITVDGVNLEGALTWAFEFEDQPYFAGFRSLASNGIDKPVLNVFRMFSKMRGQRINATSDRAVSMDDILKTGVRTDPDISALATSDDRSLRVLLWHYHDDDVAGPDAEIDLTLAEEVKSALCSWATPA